MVVIQFLSRASFLNAYIVTVCLLFSSSVYPFAEEIKGPVSAITLQADGKVLIGGSFFEVNDVTRNGIARLNIDGSLDLTFDPGGGISGSVSELSLQPDGKVLLAGRFSKFDGVLRDGVARLNSDGTLDTTFNPFVGDKNSFDSLVLQSDGRVFLGGGWVGDDGLTRVRLLRLMPDGSLDHTFISSISGGGSVSALTLQPDGKLLVGGNYFERLNADGSPDTTFFPASEIDDDVWSIALQKDGKVLVGLSYSGQLVRLDPKGNIDQTFNVEEGVAEGVNEIAVLPNGNILVAAIGIIQDSLDDGVTPALARLNANGDLDPFFNVVFATGNSSRVQEIVLLKNGKILVVGNFNRLNRMYTPGIAKLNSDGTLFIENDDFCFTVKDSIGRTVLLCL